MEKAHPIRVAILDLYEGQPNQGMRCIRDLLRQYGEINQIPLECEEFDVRLKNEVPDLSFDVYISSGGPGSPLDSEGSDWEGSYWHWFNLLLDHNNDIQSPDKKHALFICHSFQLVCRHFQLARVTSRKSTAFGVFPVHMQPAGLYEPIFNDLQDPFYAVDSRSYQVIQPDQDRLNAQGAAVLAIEKERPHVPLERAIMAMRYNDYMVGTQFHPEADPTGMSMYLQREDRKHTVIAEHGEAKWQSMIDQLNDPDKISWTYSHVMHNFLDHALTASRQTVQ